MSVYFNDEIDIASLLNMQCKIMMEHQLNTNFSTNSHGCYIPEYKLAENRLPYAENNRRNIEELE